MTLNEKIQQFELLQKEMVELNDKLNEKKSAYKKMCNEAFGIADDQPMNILQIIKAIKTVQEFDKQ